MVVSKSGGGVGLWAWNIVCVSFPKLGERHPDLVNVIEWRLQLRALISNSNIGAGRWVS